MSEMFLRIVNMSISAGWLVLAVLVLRFVLKKAPRWVHVLLWGIVAVRLICPFSIESALSLIPSPETIRPEIMMDRTPEISTGIASLDRVVNPVISTTFAPEPVASANPLQILIPVAANFWLLGVTVMLAYTVISYLLLRRKLRMAVILRDHIFQCETVRSPFVLGVVKPRIYLPYALDGQDLAHVVAHEQAHIARKDHWWKPLGFALLTVYWFNPLMWIAYFLLCRDIELACDEKVIAKLGNEQRADYTQALVSCSVNRFHIAACPLAFGEVAVKERVKSIMNYRKPAFWVIVLAVILCVILAVSMLTDPVQENTPAVILSALEPDDVQWAQITVWNKPAGDHIMMDREQIRELVSILGSLEAKDFTEKNGMHDVSVMVNCGEREILMHVAGEYVTFSFDADTAELLGNTSWSIRSESMNGFLDGIVGRGSLFNVIGWVGFDASDIDTAEATHPEFPGVVFRWTEGEITANGETLIQGMPIWNACFADLTGDGKPEVCATVSFGSGMIDTHVVVYDYANRQEYTLWDRGHFDYSLRIEDGVLLCEQYSYPGGMPFDRTGFLCEGALILADAGGGEGKRLIINSADVKEYIVSIEDRAVTEQLPTDEAIEVFYEDGQYAYSFASIRSHLVMVTYYDGSTEDIRTALEKGRAEIRDLDRFGIHYYTEPKVIPMEPTQTNLRGLVAGYLFVPINGAAYRYALAEPNPAGVTVDRLLDICTEEMPIESVVWEVYSLKEYPDMTKLLIVSGTNSDWLCEYAPAAQAEEGALQAVKEGGYVVEEDGRLTSGREALEAFYQATQKGTPAFIRVAHYLTLNPDRTAPDTYEAYKQDYPALYIHELSYDGEVFVLRTEEDVRVYEYLMKFTVSGTPSATAGKHETIDRYVLTHDNTHTWDQIWNSLFSSVAGVAIDHYTVCTDYN